MAIKQIIKNSYIYKYMAYRIHRSKVEKNPKAEMDRCYYMAFGRHADFHNPKTLIEKIYWLQLNSDTSLWTTCADKYRMRQYVESCGFGSNLPRLYGVWDDANDIDFAKLPRSFVMKTNNGCQTVEIVKDTDSISQSDIKNKFEKWLKIPYGYSGAQLHYLRIKPCILAEELLSNDYSDISPESLVDFKVWCVEGKVESVLVTYGRVKEALSLALYDVDWININHNLAIKGNHYKCDRNLKIPRPGCFDEIKRISEKLAKPFHEVRVDFYIVSEKPIIGELTFSSGFGYFSYDYYTYLGSKIDLSKIIR